MSTCSAEWNERISAFVDGETAGLERGHVEAHLAACAACARTARSFRALSVRIRRAGLARAGAPRHAPAGRAWVRRPAAIAAAGLLAAAAAVAGVRAQWPSAFEGTLARDLERQHLRSFTRAEPCEFESRDPAAVAAWVERALGYRPEVPRLAGATLLGVRRCALDGELAAHLLYRVGDRALTVFVPRGGTRADQTARGFARSGPRCTEAPLGERVCVIPREGAPQLAVADAEAPELLALLGGGR